LKPRSSAEVGSDAVLISAGSSVEVRSIQFLRGVAALGVLGFHAASRAGGSFGVGAAGVDIFFVISGFIMWVVTSRRTPKPGQFLARRAERIVPLYWLVTLATATAAILAPSAFPAMRPTASHVVQSLFFIPHRDPTGLIAPLIVPGWTLNYEIFFYLLFAGSLMAPARLRVWLVSGVLAALVALRPLGDITNSAWATYTDPILLEFAAGSWSGDYRPWLW
jgi:exopolysaccharide production protein ExoZ